MQQRIERIDPHDRNGRYPCRHCRQHGAYVIHERRVTADRDESGAPMPYELAEPGAPPRLIASASR